MKKIVLSLLAVAAMGLSANAQQVVKFGPKAGVNFANMNGAEDASAITSFHVGGFAEIFFTDKFAVQPELLYSMQGASYESMGTEADMKLDYINIPIMAKYYVIDRLAVEAGPYVGFLTKADLEGVDVKDNFKSVDFGLGLGASYNLANGFFGGARYNFGFSDIVDENSGDAIKNGVIQISVGYKF